MKIRGIVGTKGARRAGAVWGVLFLAAAACGPAFSATPEWGTYLGGSGVAVAGETHTADQGALLVTFIPPQAAAAGAQWRRVGTETWFDNGSVEESIPAGTVKVEFKAGDYWTVPPVQTVTVTAGLTAVASAECAPAGALRITLTPEEAALAGAQWRRGSGGAWFDGGVTEAHIPPGEWILEFKSLDYWTAPSYQWVTVTAGSITEASAEYAPAGALRVTLAPPDINVAAVGAQWRRVGTKTWRDSGTTEWRVSPGGHQVEFKAVAGWTPPPAQPVTVTAGATTELAASYTDNRGVLRVTITPPEAVAAGAQWRREGTATWCNSGVEVITPAGDWQVQFKTVAGFFAPAAQPVTVTAGATSELAAVYTTIAPGALRVTIMPPEAVAAGAQWRRMGTTTWRVPGATEAGVPVGNYEVEFKAVSGWIAPSAQPVTVTTGATSELSALYTTNAPGAIRVTITPAAAVASGAQWRRVGTTPWFDSGATETAVPAGAHEIELKAVSGWTAPPAQTVNVFGGSVLDIGVTYSPYYWGTYLGGSDRDQGRAVALDGDGNIFVVGSTCSTGWVSGGWDTAINDGVYTTYDAFLAKLSPDGAHVWSTYLGHTFVEYANAVALDANGNMLVAGQTNSPGWVSGFWDTVLNDGVSSESDGFLVKLSPAGVPVWSTYLGGTGWEMAKAVAVDADGNVLVAGETYSPGWVSGGWDTRMDVGESSEKDGFLVKVSSAGEHLWSTYLGAVGGEDVANAVAVDANGNVLVAGETTGTWNWVSGGWNTVRHSYDGFLVKFAPSGTHEWSTYLGGEGGDAAAAVAVDGSGGVLVCGTSYTPGWVSGGACTAYGDSGGGFLVRLSPSGAHEWSTYLGGTGKALALDAGGDLYVAGNTGSAGWVSGGWDTVLDTTADTDCFVLRLSAAGDHVWSSYVGALKSQYSCGVAVAGDGAVVVAGETETSGWISGGYDDTYSGEVDGFVVKAAQTVTRGAIRVTLTPPEAVAAGVRWRRMGAVAWRGSGEVEEGVCPGEWRVEFQAVPGWAAPSVQPVTVLAGETAELTAAFAPTGSLRVTITPAEVVAAGAQWRRVGTTTWLNSGTTEAELVAGNYQVEFKAAAGWITPSARSVTVAAGVTTQLAAVYTAEPPGAILVTITPAEAMAAGAKWRRVGTATWRNGGTIETEVRAGNYEVEFKAAAAGWIAPPVRPVTVAVGVTTQLTAVYTNNGGALRVTITPAEAVAAGAQWRRTGTTAWFDSGAVESSIYPGTYQVEFKAVPGWRAKGVQTVTVPAGTTAEASGEYAPFTEISATPRAGTWVTNGDVRAVATTPGTTYIGGDFTYVGPNTGCYAALDAATEAPLTPYAKVNGTVLACVSDGGGGWYIGGDFTQVGTVTRYHIAHILHNGALDPAWNPNANSQVRVLAVSGRMVYAGGEFTHIGGQQRYHVAALDAVSGAATCWDPNVNGFVNALAVSGNTVYAGGDFTTIGGQARNYIAALNAKTGATLGWNPHADDFVHTLAVSGGVVYAGGDFTTIGGQARNRIAALDTATGGALAWNPGADNTVSVLVVPGGTVYAGGAFSTIGGQTRSRIAALDAVTGIVTSWNPNADGAVSALAVSGGTVYAGGAFSTIGGQARSRIAVLDAVTGAATAWDLNAGGTVHTLAVSGTKVCAGGAFTSIGGRTRNRIAALDAATGVATSWNPNANSQIRVLAVSGGTVYAGGDFSAIGGQPRNCIAALSAATGSAISWNPNANGSVHCLAVSGATVYAGGAFTGIGGQTRNRIAALDAATGSATSWNPNANGRVSALAVSGTTVYAGGQFTGIGGQTRNRIAALDAATGALTSWNPNANGMVHCLAVSGSTVYVGGRFTGIAGQTRNSIAALNAATGSATSWNPGATYLPGLVTADVYALAVSGTTVYAGGHFFMFGGRMRMNAASVTVADSRSTAWDPGAHNDIYALSVSGSTLYAGGHFSKVDWVSQPGFAQFDPPVGPAPPSKPLAEDTGTDRIVWTWQDNSDEEEGYKVYGDPGMELPGTLQTTTTADTTSCEQTGLTPNTLYTFQAAATNAVGDSEKTELYAAWTLAEVAAPPVVTNPTPSSLDVTLNADSNSEGTLYAIQLSPEAGGGTWVQEDGSAGTTPVYQPVAVWGTVTVTGLAPQTPYSFSVTARNWDGVDAAAGPAASGITRNAPLPPGPVVINGGAGSTNTTTVTLTLTWSPWAGFEVRRMRFSNDGATWSPWEPLAATRAWTLPEGDGYKTVRVQFLDRAGNYSERFSDYIRVDTTPPTGTIVINGNQPATLSPEVTLSLTWDDAGGSGARRMRFSDNGSTWSPWQSLSATRAHPLPATPGYHTVRVTYRDAAGNVSERFADYIRLNLP